jgi:solute carrier family 39 (zinc transporter), member 1/2/3
LVSFGIAICVHSLIDGLAIGIYDEIGTIAVLSISVVIHKIPVAITVGQTFKSQNQALKLWSTLTVFIAFIVATPIGMIIGLAVSENKKTSIALPILQALSGGTFVYLVCCDLLIHEFHSHKNQSKMLAFLKMMMFIFGATIVVVLIAVAPAHDH